MLKSDELKAEKKKLLDRNEELAKQVETRELTPEEDTEFNTNVTAVEELNTQIAKAERSEWVALQRQAPAMSTTEVRSLNAAPYVKSGRKSDPAHDEAALLKAFVLGKGDSYTMTLANARGIDIKASGIEMSQLETRDLNSTNATDLIPSGFMPTLIEKLKAYSMFRQFGTVFSTVNGNDWPWPTADNTAGQAAAYAENADVVDDGSTDPSFGQVTFKRYRRSTPVMRLSLDLLANTGIPDFPGVIARFLAGQRGRKEASENSGNNAGTTAPQGFFNGLTVEKNLPTGNALDWTDLIDLEVSIDPAYLNEPGTKGYVMHPVTFGAVRKFANSQNTPIYITNIATGDNGTSQQMYINGYPVYMCNEMAKITDSTLNVPLIAFGLISDYAIRDIPSQTELVTYRESYRKAGQLGLQLEYWWDARWLRSDSVKTINTATS